VYRGVASKVLSVLASTEFAFARVDSFGQLVRGATCARIHLRHNHPAIKFYRESDASFRGGLFSFKINKIMVLIGVCIDTF